RDMGPPARWILVHNDTHVNAMDDPVGCGSGLVQTFIRDPGRLTHMNESGHGRPLPGQGDLRRGPAPLLRLRPALGSQPVRPLPGERIAATMPTP
ncbi:MAG TPA: hypothetical protein VGQ26_12770, partial [Streptosporangiaceae bacterium]|nr:hypothetical protein [Streptosporangiaceae bacterium]